MKANVIRYKELYFEEFFQENFARERAEELKERYSHVFVDSFVEKNGWFRKRTVYRVHVYVEDH